MNNVPSITENAPRKRRARHCGRSARGKLLAALGGAGAPSFVALVHHGLQPSGGEEEGSGSAAHAGHRAAHAQPMGCASRCVRLPGGIRRNSLALPGAQRAWWPMHPRQGRARRPRGRADHARGLKAPLARGERFTGKGPVRYTKWRRCPVPLGVGAGSFSVDVPRRQHADLLEQATCAYLQPRSNRPLRPSLHACRCASWIMTLPWRGPDGAWRAQATGFVGVSGCCACLTRRPRCD